MLPQLHAVFYGEFYTVPFMREGTIPPNWRDIVKQSSQNFVPENIDLRGNYFTTYLEEYLRETPSHKPSVSTDNYNKILMSPQSKPNVQESPSSEGAPVSGVIKRPASEGVQNIPNLKEVYFDQKSSNGTSGMPSCKVENGEKVTKMPKMFYLE